jgi:hypothetical protein
LVGHQVEEREVRVREPVLVVRLPHSVVLADVVERSDVGEAMVALRAAIERDVAEAGLPVGGGIANRSRQHYLHR